MQVVKALKQVLRLCPKGKDTSLFSYVRFCKAKHDSPSCIFTTDGVTTFLVRVDEDLPDALISSELLRAVSRYKGEVTICQLGYGVVEFRTALTSSKLQGEGYNKFPERPMLPKMEELFNWSAVNRVVYAASKVEDNESYPFLHFTDYGVEAFDGCRFARMEVETGLMGLLPIKAFKSWPAGKAFYSMDKNNVYFQVGDEFRITKFQNTTFPNTREGIPMVGQGHRVLVNTEELKTALAFGIEATGFKFLGLDINQREILIYPFGVERTGNAEQVVKYDDLYCAVIPIQFAFDADVPRTVVHLDGRYLVEAVKQACTPNVVLSWESLEKPYRPMRIDAGPYTACVWPLVV